MARLRVQDGRLIFHLPGSAVQIVAGETARLKTTAIQSTSRAITARLESLGETT